MYRRTGGATSSYSGLIPYEQATNDTRTLSVRVNRGEDVRELEEIIAETGAKVLIFDHTIRTSHQRPRGRSCATP